MTTYHSHQARSDRPDRHPLYEALHASAGGVALTSEELARLNIGAMSPAQRGMVAELGQKMRAAYEHNGTAGAAWKVLQEEWPGLEDQLPPVVPPPDPTDDMGPRELAALATRRWPV